MIEYTTYKIICIINLLARENIRYNYIWPHTTLLVADVDIQKLTKKINVIKK